MAADNDCVLCFYDMSRDNKFIFIGIKAFYWRVLEYLQELLMLRKNDIAVLVYSLNNK